MSTIGVLSALDVCLLRFNGTYITASRHLRLVVRYSGPFNSCFPAKRGVIVVNDDVWQRSLTQFAVDHIAEKSFPNSDKNSD